MSKMGDDRKSLRRLTFELVTSARNNVVNVLNDVVLLRTWIDGASGQSRCIKRISTEAERGEYGWLRRERPNDHKRAARKSSCA